MLVLLSFLPIIIPRKLVLDNLDKDNIKAFVLGLLITIQICAQCYFSSYVGDSTSRISLKETMKGIMKGMKCTICKGTENLMKGTSEM